jgi:hypothetical protein
LRLHLPPRRVGAAGQLEVAWHDLGRRLFSEKRREIQGGGGG